MCPVGCDLLIPQCSVLDWLEVERAWSVHKLQNHIQARNSDYEAKYREFLQQQYPETWTSYRVFENTRVLYNHVTRLGVLSTFNLQCSKYCDFLDPELSQETTITIMKEIIATCVGGFGALVTREQQVVALELLLLCVWGSGHVACCCGSVGKELDMDNRWTLEKEWVWPCFQKKNKKVCHGYRPEVPDW